MAPPITKVGENFDRHRASRRAERKLKKRETREQTRERHLRRTEAKRQLRRKRVGPGPLGGMSKEERRIAKERSRFLRKYGVTPEERDRLVAVQGGVCPICDTKLTLDRGKTACRARIDHCHETGSIRGALCHYCNVGLGHFKDNPKLLEAAAQYLRRAGKP